jgi:hypothetical protein
MITNTTMPLFLRHVRLGDKDNKQLEQVMSGWGKIFHRMAELKAAPLPEQRTALEKMLVYELEHDRRLVIMTRLLGRYKVTLNNQLHQQMFECVP